MGGVNSRFPGPSLRSLASHQEGQDGLRRGDGWIVFHHFRKCAGTTLRELLLAWMSRHASSEVVNEVIHRQVWTGGGLRLYEQEWGAVAPDHLVAEPPVVLVTCIRHPVERWASEFHYAGPGADRSLRGRALVASWREWLANPDEHRGARGVRRTRYFDNFFIRSLLGAPTDGIVRLRPDVPHFGDYHIFGGGAPLFGGAVGRSELERALRVLSSFDLVLVTERLKHACTREALRRVLGEEVSVGHARRSAARPRVPREVEDLLLEQNAWDIELFETVQEQLPAAFDPRLRRLERAVAGATAREA